MDLAAFRANFPRQLRYWTLHSILNALPSLGISLGWLELRKSPAATAAIFTAIATFILLYATVTSWIRPTSDRSNLLFRSLDLGLKIRVLMTIMSLFAIMDQRSIIFAPDTWCGLGAGFCIDWLSRLFGFGPLNSNSPTDMGFLAVYAVTMLEGFILSFLLLMISFFALIVLQAKDKRKAFASA
ncbi:hypothetical protein [Luteolibacter soli]|uniref:Uncharacterized protein n=1 Tax=Luteolibacter soli TaxID=3135280 RepID=A0ABU9AUU2_9BACT